jgi:hypothetical protein
MGKYPKIIAVKSKKGKKLLVTFSNGIKKLYDCSPLLESDVFSPLSNDAIFNTVHVDKHGYGVIWTDEIDLSESELWINGLNVDC